MTPELADRALGPDGLATARPPASGAEPPLVRSAAAAGDWPRTTRVLPWLLATFLVGLFLTPLDGIQLPVSLPFDSKLDRVLVALMVVIWLGSKLMGRSTGGDTRTAGPIYLALFLFVVAALASILVNTETLTNAGEFDPAIKQLGVLVSFILFFCVVASVVRPAEIKPFTTLIVVLASLTAIGVIYEYHSDTNVFFSWTDSILPPGFKLSFAEYGIDSSGRQGTTGPTQHGLAIVAMLALVIPFAMVGWFQARGFLRKLLYLSAIWLLIAAAIATERKSAIVVPLVVVVVLVAYRPQQMLKMVPVLAVMVAAVPILSPGALDSLREHLFTPQGFAQDASTGSRTEDYDAVRPDVLSHLAIGRGFGSYDSRTYRFLDNQFLSLIVETGILGLAAFLMALLAIVRVTHRVIKSRDPVRGPPALAITAATAAFAVATLFYSSLAFVQVPYLFFFLAGLAAVLATRREEQPVPQLRRLEVMPA